MKILWLSHLVPYPPKGGALQRSYNMIREIGKYHEITLVAFNQMSLLERSLPKELFPLLHAKEMLLKSVESVTTLDIPEESIPKGRYYVALKALLKGKAYNMEWLRSLEAERVISKTLRDNVFDVVHVDTISLAPYFDLFNDLPIVLNHHNFESDMLRKRAETEQSSLKALFFRYEASRLLKSEIEFSRKAQLNLVCSDLDAENMQYITEKDNFLTVPNGVDISYFYPNTKAKIVKNSIVIVGGMSWYPNREAVEYFIRDIWPIIKPEFPDMEVHIIGRSPTEKIISFSNSESNVFLHGFVEDVRDYLWAAHFYFCPIKTGGGTKLKILDALATGCCIIADPFSCEGINVVENENVLFASSPQDYLNSIKRILNNPDLEETVKVNGPKLIREQYSYSSIGSLYSSKLSDLVEDYTNGDQRS